MADIKSTIKIDVEGLEKFIKATQKLEAELKDLEDSFRPNFKGSEKELKQYAKEYQNKQIAAEKAVEKAKIQSAKAVEREELKRVAKVSDAQRIATKVATRLTIGRGAAEFAQNIIRGLGDVIEKNKEANSSLRGLSKGLDDLKAGAAKLALVFLTTFGPVLTKGLNVIKSVAEGLFGISFESDKASDSLRKTQLAFNDEIEILKTANLTQEERRELINKINTEYKDYLPNLLTEKSSIEEIEAAQFGANKEMEKKINMMAAEEQFLDLSKRRLDNLKAIKEEEKRLTKAIEDENKANKSKFLTVSQGGNTDLVNAKARRINSEQALINSKKELDIIEEEFDTLRQITVEQKIQFGTVAKVAKTDKEIEASLKSQNDYLSKQNELYNKIVSVSNLVSNNIGESFNLNIDSQDFNTAQKQLELLKFNIEKFKKDTEGSITAKSSLGILGSELLGLEVENAAIIKSLTGTKGNIVDIVFDVLKKDAKKGSVDLSEFLNESILSGLDLSSDVISKISGSGGGLFKLFETPLLNEQEANLVFKRVFDSSKTFVENLKALAEEGITSPIFESLIINQDSLDKANKEYKKALIDSEKFGTDRAKQLEDMEKDLADKQSKFDKAKISSTFDTNKALLDLIKERNKQSLKEGKLLEEDLVEENTRRQKFELDAVEKSIEEQIRVNTLAGDKVSIAQLQTLGELQLQRTTLIKTHLTELEDLGEELTKLLFSQFQVDFTSTADELETGLETLNLKIRTATRVLDETFTKFGDKRSQQGEELSKDEIDIINTQIDTIEALEIERYKQELALRVTSFSDFLNQLKLESDVKIKLINDFYNEEVKLAEDNVDKLNDINARRPDTPEKLKKSHTEILNSANIVQQSLSDVFSAYVSFQDAVAQKAIDKISKQLSNLDTELSDTTSKIDSLESDLEGKRSGRREAILRGLEIERAREEALNMKKIELEKKLRAAEKKASEERKAASIAQAIINGAIAITGTWAGYASLGVPGTVLAAIQTAAIGAVTGFQIAEISQQEFGDGGLVEGASHSNGGVQALVDGVRPVEIEGGEIIINKVSSQLYRDELSAINVKGGGKKFASGGDSANFLKLSSALSGSQRRDIEKLSQTPIYVNVTDISNLQGRNVRVNDQTSI